jgi:YVTN family beta-propeller protein
MPPLTRLVLPFLAAALPAQAFTDYASGPVQPARLSADGSRLFVADTAGGRLCVFDLRDPSSPLLLAEIPVGLDPVSVNPRTSDEVWVVNQLSDSVSIVSLARRCVIGTLHVQDEPSDVVFAGGRAFVSAATTDDVKVFDVASWQLVGTVAVLGKDPRALATSPDGSVVYAVVQRSGNGTTTINENAAPLPPPPTNTALPTAPRQGIIVRADDPAWAAQIPFTLPDNDVAEIDAATLTVNRYFGAVGTTNTAIAVHPLTGELWVANTDARNLVRFEPNVRGHAIDSRLTRITVGATPVVTAFDLNAGLDYTTLPNPAALATALSEPFGVAIDTVRDRVYVAAQGTDRVGVLDRSGNVVARVEIGSTPGAAVNSRDKRGPRALALHPTASRLYVLNRLSDTLSVVDTGALTVLSEQPIASVDPMPAALRTGRRFLYDAKLSGNGTMSCAACHIDGDTDGLAWDLGDPNGSMTAPPSQPFPFSLGLTSIHPMKGPRTTQTLRGIGGTEPLHWGGDRATFDAFNPAFDKLMGSAQLATADMTAFGAYATAIAFPPNPNEPLDRNYLAAPVGNNQAAGFAAFTAPVANIPIIGAVSCSTCHALPIGSNRMLITSLILMEVQQMKVPQLRSVYRKTGFQRAAAPQKSGFGYTKDGVVDTLATFLNLSQFNTWPVATKDDIATFLMAFDTGTAPTVGYQTTIDQTNATSAAVTSDLALLTARALAGDIDLIAQGVLDGRAAGLLYSPASGTFAVDRTGEGPHTLATLVARAQNGLATLTFTGVTPGSGTRLALDRDLDGARNGDENGLAYGIGTAGCNGDVVLLGNSEPRVANAGFALVADHGPVNGGGLLALGLAPASLPVAGVTLLVDLSVGFFTFVPTDGLGVASYRLPIPANPALAGLPLYAQVAFVDACAPGGLSSSRGLSLSLRP